MACLLSQSLINENRLTLYNKESVLTLQDLEIEELQETIKNLETTWETTQAELKRVMFEQKKDKEDSDERGTKHRLEIERLTKELEEVKETFRLVSS